MNFIIPRSFYNIYSTYEQGLQVIKYFKFMFGKDTSKYIITDATAGIGGNSRLFCKYFGFVNSIEVNKYNCNILKENLKNYNNKSILNTNYVEIFTNLKQDIVFLDPPWGTDYKSKNNIKLYLNEYDVNYIVSTLYWYSSLVILKAPCNYFITKSNKWKIKTFPIYNNKKIIYNIIFYYR